MNRDLVGLVNALYNGDPTAAGPLYDVRREHGDERADEYRRSVGNLLNGGHASFRMQLRSLFWPELSDSQEMLKKAMVDVKNQPKSVGERNSYDLTMPTLSGSGIFALDAPWGMNW